jgi:hypothetical protein
LASQKKQQNENEMDIEAHIQCNLLDSSDANIKVQALMDSQKGN